MTDSAKNSVVEMLVPVGLQAQDAMYYLLQAILPAHPSAC
jgi:hypothetical protein